MWKGVKSMKKQPKRRMIVFLSICLIICIVQPSSLALAKEERSDNTVLPKNTIINAAENSKRMINPVRNRKKNVKTYETWSSYKRVSDNVKFGKKGGSISADRTVTFSVVVSGNISGLGISTSGSVSSKIGYTLNADPNTTSYLGYKVRYKVEEGINEFYDSTNGRVIASNKYTVKKPLYGQYALIKV